MTLSQQTLTATEPGKRSPDSKTSYGQCDVGVANRHRRAAQFDARRSYKNASPSYSVRPNGAVHQWREVPRRELSVDPGS